MLNVFGRKRNNRGIMWASLLGLGVGAAAFGFRRNGNRDSQNLVRNFLNKETGNEGRVPNIAPLMELSKELGIDKNISEK